MGFLLFFFHLRTITNTSIQFIQFFYTNRFLASTDSIDANIERYFIKPGLRILNFTARFIIKIQPDKYFLNDILRFVPIDRKLRHHYVDRKIMQLIKFVILHQRIVVYYIATKYTDFMTKNDSFILRMINSIINNGFLCL